MLKAVLFDLDGTLLPMDQDLFVENYFILLAKKFIAFGYEPNALIKAVKHATEAMLKNNGFRTNEAVFWDDYINTFGGQARSHGTLFTDFYKKEFQKLQEICGFNYNSAKIVRDLKNSGVRVFLATNPIFPAIAMESRIRWAGLEPEDFEFFTSYENIGFCKPNLAYYRELIHRIGLSPHECVMVGNDVTEDMVADQLGIRVFLMTENLINENNADIDQFPHGDFDDLRAFLRK